MEINNAETMVDTIVRDAYNTRVSDIHIEPAASQETTMIRFRIDGVCQEYIQAPDAMAADLVTKIKSMADLDIDECRLPQDGYIRFRRKHAPEFDIRVTTFPTNDSKEDMVLRIVTKSKPRELDNLAFSERNLKIVKDLIQKPQGMFLVAGPDDSGKTTTLHAMLASLNKSDIKIVTAEDSIKIKQWGIRQLEIKPLVGLDFARAVRSFLRADSDVIMIGQMLDRETISVGVKAAVAGSLLFSTLQTSNAAESIMRLLDLRLDSVKLCDALLGVLAQRLVRKLCSHCREQYHPSIGEYNEMADEYGQTQFAATGIQYNKELILYRPVGCDQCCNTGYTGRLAIHELMEITPKIKSMIARQANPAIIFKQAIRDGMLTLKQDGILKVFQGLTDMSEIRSACII